MALEVENNEIFDVFEKKMCKLGITQSKKTRFDKKHFEHVNLKKLTYI